MPEPVERERPDLSQGGIVAVILGHGGDIPTDYALHKQVITVEAWRLDDKDVANEIPENTRAVVFGGGDRLPRPIFESIHALLKKRRTPYFLRDSAEGVRQSLDELIPRVNRPRLTAAGANGTAAAATAKPAVARGTVKSFIETHAPVLIRKHGAAASHADLGRELFKLAQREGIDTTIGSMLQGVRVWARTQQRGTVPASAQPEPVRVRARLQQAIAAAEQQAADLRACLAYVADVEERLAAAEAKIAKAREVFATFGGDIVGHG